MASDTTGSGGVNDFEIYIRFNEDQDKDYAFHIDSDTTFEDLQNIFKTLPISLRPSVFYDTKPAKFGYSTSPGYLTANGGLLYNYNADQPRFTKYPKSQLDKVSDYVWPEQLILPSWNFNHFHNLNVILLLLAWLYTDLPDFISPTPGICLTNVIFKLLAFLIISFTEDDNHPWAKNILKETALNNTGKPGQIIFFVFHVLKCLMIYSVMYFGIANPYEANYLVLFGRRMKNFVYSSLLSISTTNASQELSAEKLLKIGWTGTRKVCIDDYIDFYRNHIIAEHGGVVKAHTKGILKDLNSRFGVLLGEGEGFETPLPKNHREELLKYPLNLLATKNFPGVVKDTVEFLEKDQVSEENEETVNAETKKEVEDEAKIKASKVEPLSPLFTDSAEGLFKMSYKFYSFYNISFLYNNDLFSNDDYKSELYRFNGIDAVRNFRKYGSFVTKASSWKKYFDFRNSLGDCRKNDK
ncbi:Gsf2 protein [Saccharomycopsis crataegensis]|uniref:Gsf2 protein n=1 Tax=Saccharomycopsis crataegensis TaxID=43959 RepID=A0AAV5QGS8_9ASCO|nr:Gsf2 protein [Saccharomycopsis crataegensis]